MFTVGIHSHTYIYTYKYSYIFTFKKLDHYEALGKREINYNRIQNCLF